MHISSGGGAAARLQEQLAEQLQATQAANAASTTAPTSTATGTDPFPALLQASPANPAASASSAAPDSLSALLAAQEQNGANDLAGNLSSLDKLLSGVTGSSSTSNGASAQPSLSATV